MKGTGITRPIDHLGRVVIPKEIRDSLMIFEGNLVEFFVSGRTISLQKIEDTCVFCGNEKQLIELNGLLTCKKCFENLKIRFS